MKFQTKLAYQCIFTYITIQVIQAQITIRKQVFYQMDFTTSPKALEGWIYTQGKQMLKIDCDPSDKYSTPFIYGTRNINEPKTNQYYCIPDSIRQPVLFEITREVNTNLPHYQINFDIELILYGDWAVQGINGCTRSDFIQLIADQKQFKFSLQNAIKDQIQCLNTNDGYLIKITDTLEHKALKLDISLQSNALSDFTMVSFGIRKFDVTSNLCPDEKCVSCNDQYSCLRCLNNYLVSYDGRRCEQSCPQNYLIQAGRCVRTCGENAILEVATKTCIVCDANCEICSSQTYCQKCHLQYYQFRGKCYTSCPIDSTNPIDGSNQCNECSKGCIECGQQGTCRRCEARHVLVNGKCEACSDTNCAVCQNGGLYGCLQCDKGFFFSEKKCISDQCQDNDYRVSNKECQVCMGGFYYDFSSHSCIECHSLCHDCTGTSWDECKECSPTRWRSNNYNSNLEDIYSSKVGICECNSSNEFDILNDTCQAIGHWDVMTDIMLFIIFFASVQLAYRGKMIYLMNFMYFIQSIALLGFLNMQYPYFIQDMLESFNRVNLPSLFPRVFIVDENKMYMNGRSQVVYFKNHSSEIEDIFSNPKFMLYYDRTSSFLLNIPNWMIINTIPLIAYIFIVVYEKMKQKKFYYDKSIRNEIIPFFLYHSLVDIYFYVIMQFEHASTNGSIQVVGTIGAVISLVILIVVLYFHTYSLSRCVIAFKNKEKDHNIFRFSIYLRDINFINGNIFQQNFRTIQSLKQFVLVCCIVGAYSNPVTQAILVVVFQFVYYMILLVVKPFSQESNNRQQIIYETLLFFSIFLGCWYELSFFIEGQGIKKFVAVVFIIVVVLFLSILMVDALYNLYRIEKPLFKLYMKKRLLITQEKHRLKIIQQMKKNSITEFDKNDIDQSKDSDSVQNENNNQKKNIVSNRNNNNQKIIQTPKSTLPNGLKTTKNQVLSKTNKNANQTLNNNEEYNIQLGPDYRDINKNDFPPFNNSILMSDVPPISAINGGQSRRNPYAQNNYSMSYYLNETDQNIMTETNIKQQQDNPNILSVLDDEISQNLENQSVVRLSERQEHVQDNNGRFYQVASNQKYRALNSRSDIDSVYNPQTNQNRATSTNNPEKQNPSQSYNNDFYNKQSYRSTKNAIPNDFPGISNNATRIEDYSALNQTSSNLSITQQKNENQQSQKSNDQRNQYYQALNYDEQSLGIGGEKSITNNNEEDDYNRTFIISQNAIQSVTDHHLINDYLNQNKQNPTRHISKTIGNNIEQPPRVHTGIHNRTQNDEMSSALNQSNSQYPRVNTENGNRFNNYQDNSYADVSYKNLSRQQLDQSVVAHNNYHSQSKADIYNDPNSQVQNDSVLNHSILNQSMEPIRRNETNSLNSSTIKKSIQKDSNKGVQQQPGRRVDRLADPKQEIVKAFKESPTKPQKLVTKKKKTNQSSMVHSNQQSQMQHDMPNAESSLHYLHQQTNQFIKKALDTELMYKWKDQQYNYNDDDDEF